jgi:hypothetical protein
MASDRSATIHQDAKAVPKPPALAKPRPPQHEIVYEGASFFSIPGKKAGK